MKEIALPCGLTALVDDEDYERLSKFDWYSRVREYTAYVYRWDGRSYIAMHQDVLGKRLGFNVDHANRNGLDNRKSNLRFATQSQNMANSAPRKNASSQFKGVSWDSANIRWLATIRKNYVNHYLGRFTCEEEAARAYDKKAKELYGEFADLNFSDAVAV